MVERMQRVPDVLVVQNPLLPLANPQDDEVAAVAYEALRHLTAAAVVSGIACAAWIFPWTSVITVPAMLLYGAYYDSFPFQTINAIIGSESYQQIAQKTEDIARSLLGSLFPLGSMEVGIGVFGTLYGLSLISANASFLTLTLAALCISFSLQKLLPSGLGNLSLCNSLLQRESDVLMELNAYLKEVLERRSNGDFKLDAEEVTQRIAEIYLPKAEDILG